MDNFSCLEKTAIKPSERMLEHRGLSRKMLNEELIARVCWLYYKENMTQSAIADRLNLTRRRVNEMLASARQSGLVQISLKTEFSECVEAGAALRKKYGIRDAVVIPAPDNADLLVSALGQAGAAYLNRYISLRKPEKIGVGWGHTLAYMVRHLQTFNIPGMTVYSVMGGLPHGTELNSFEVARSFAQNLGAASNYILTPLYADSPESRDVIIQQPVFKKVFDQIESFDIAMLTVGGVTDESLLIRYALPENISSDDIVRSDAVGDLAGRFFTASGAEADHAINHQVFSPEVEQLKKIDNLVVVSGGAHKIGILNAVLRSGLVSTLISDLESVRQLL